MTDSNPGFSAKEFADLAGRGWHVDVLSEKGRHISFDRPDFPAQIDVMFDSHEEEWKVGLYVFNEQRGMMDLLSADYAASYAAEDKRGVRHCINKYMNEIEGGDLNAYRSDVAAMNTE